MNKSSNVPQIRFKGFSEPWRENTVGDVSYLRGRIGFRGYKREDLVESYNGVITFSPSDIDDEGHISYEDNDYISLYKYEESPEIKVSVGDILFTKTASIGKIGYVNFLPRKATINPQFALITPNEKINRYFLFLSMRQERFMNKVWGITGGSSIPTMSQEKLKEISFNAPKRKEQEKIGSLFEKLDSVITLQKEKHEQLQNIKKSLLENMFPSEGEEVPKIRFKGFNKKWITEKFQYFFEERSERSGEGEMISVTINSGVKRFKDLNRYSSKPEDMSNYKVVKCGDIAYNSMRMWQGASGYSPYDGILSPAYTVITPKEGVSSKFFSYVLKRGDMINQFITNSQGLTKDTWNLKFPAFNDIFTRAPLNHTEQVKIGQLFEKLDNLIELNQDKLDKLEKIKKSLLDKMFV